MEEAKVEKPLGIAILAVLNIIGGIFAIIGGASIAALTGVMAAEAIPGIFGVIIGVFGGILIIMGILGVAVGWGFWKGKEWAWIIGLTFYIISIILSLVGAVQPPYTGIVGVIIGALLVYYLFRPNVKSWFVRA